MRNKRLILLILILTSCGGYISRVNTFKDDDIDSDPAKINLVDSHAYVKNGNTFIFTPKVENYTGELLWVLIDGPAEMTINEDTGEIYYETSLTGDFDVTIKVTDSLNNFVTGIFTLHVNEYGLCVWTGNVNTDWTNNSNWSFCNNTIPQIDDWIAVSSSASYQPELSANTTVVGIGDSEINGGTITIGENTTLTFTDSSNGTIKSSITFISETPDCTTCKVNNISNADFVITNNATLTLIQGITLTLHHHTEIIVGNGTQSGNLATYGNETDSSTWPMITCNISDHMNGIRVLGNSSRKSSVNINGLKIRSNDHSNTADTRYSMAFLDYYEILGLDNVIFEYHYASDQRSIFFNNCYNAIFTDTHWSNLNMTFNGTPPTSIDAACDPGIKITIEGNCPGDCETTAIDTFEVIEWID